MGLSKGSFATNNKNGSYVSLAIYSIETSFKGMVGFLLK